MAEPVSKKASPEQIALRNRRVYLQLRLPELRQQTKDLIEERKKVGERLKSADKLKGDQLKTLNQRFIYLREHIKAVKDDVKTLSEERQTVMAKLRA